MDTAYLGKLGQVDPLYEILLPQVCPDLREPVFHVNKMPSFEVYKYTEEETGVAVIGKWIFAEPEMEMLNLTPFFKITVLSSRIGFKKPDCKAL